MSKKLLALEEFESLTPEERKRYADQVFDECREYRVRTAETITTEELAGKVQQVEEDLEKAKKYQEKHPEWMYGKENIKNLEEELEWLQGKLRERQE